MLVLLVVVLRGFDGVKDTCRYHAAEDGNRSFGEIGNVHLLELVGNKEGGAEAHQPDDNAPLERHHLELLLLELLLGFLLVLLAGPVIEARDHALAKGAISNVLCISFGLVDCVLRVLLGLVSRVLGVVDDGLQLLATLTLSVGPAAEEHEGPDHSKYHR